MIQVDKNHYLRDSYDSKYRFISYWYQINEILNLNSNNTLEIGIGSGFVAKYLIEKGINITTLDFDRNLEPDVAGNILSIPFKKGSFDVICCYEVLEHLPYENFRKALEEMFLVSNEHVLISLPDAERLCLLNIQLPILGKITGIMSLPRLIKPQHRFDGQHYWMIGRDGYPLNRISNDMKNIGFEIIKTYRAFEYPLHRFFVLKKQ